MTRARVILAEDHAEVAELLRHILEAEFEVVATGDDGNALLAAAKRFGPDVVVTDIAMPGLDGIAATRELLRRCPATRVDWLPGTTIRGWLNKGWGLARSVTC